MLKYTKTSERIDWRTTSSTRWRRWYDSAKNTIYPNATIIIYQFNNRSSSSTQPATTNKSDFRPFFLFFFYFFILYIYNIIIIYTIEYTYVHTRYISVVLDEVLVLTKIPIYKINPPVFIVYKSQTLSSHRIFMIRHYPYTQHMHMYVV